jgi:circadian clock protein KaiB
MKKNPVKDPLRENGEVPADADIKKYVLKLYVAGMTPGSVRAIANAKQICEEYLVGCYLLEVVDLYQQPLMAREEQITAVPALIKILPLPSRRVVGDLSDTQRVLQGLELPWKR